MFISVDGPNGVGKSTVINEVVNILSKKGFRVHLTKEVSATPIGEFIRKFHKQYRGKTLALLVAADRQNHIDQDILPALKQNDFVITDRYIGSSLVFQRLDGVELPFLWKLNSGFLMPNLSVFITASPDTIISRMANRKALDRFEETFSRKNEVRLFNEASAFMKTKNVNVYTFQNNEVTVSRAAATLARKIYKLKAACGSQQVHACFS